MKKSYSSKAFTLIELMVSIFITITIIASFYKLYNASVKTERSASIRVAVNLMGEQMIDTIAETVRLIGLNSSEVDFLGDSTAGLLPNIILSAKENELVFFSPFGSPITKVKGAKATDNFPSCTFTLFNSAAFHSGVTKLYFHNQDGVFKTSTMSVSSSSGDSVTVTATFDASGSGLCKDMFPNGSLVTGEDFKYTLQYGASGDDNELKLSCEKEVAGVWTADPNCSLIDFSYSDENAATNFYSMPKFILEYLIETCDTSAKPMVCTTKWESSSEGFDSAKIKEIIAVRFGFVLLSRKERIYAGNDTPGTLPKYCIFEDVIEGNSDLYCYQLPSLNYTASVFRRIIYLSNYRFFIDQNR